MPVGSAAAACLTQPTSYYLAGCLSDCTSVTHLYAVLNQLLASASTVLQAYCVASLLQYGLHSMFTWTCKKLPAVAQQSHSVADCRHVS
jgi:hypothetical protein